MTVELSSVKEGSFVTWEGKLFALISKHGNGLALVRQIADGQHYVEWPTQHVELSQQCQVVKIHYS